MAEHTDVLAKSETAYNNYAAQSASVFDMYGTGDTGVSAAEAKSLSFHAMAELRGYTLGDKIEQHVQNTLENAKSLIAGTLQTPLVMADAVDAQNIAPASEGENRGRG